MGGRFINFVKVKLGGVMKLTSLTERVQLGGCTNLREARSSGRSAGRSDGSERVHLAHPPTSASVASFPKEHQT